MFRICSQLEPKRLVTLSYITKKYHHPKYYILLIPQNVHISSLVKNNTFFCPVALLLHVFIPERRKAAIIIVFSA